MSSTTLQIVSAFCIWISRITFVLIALTSGASGQRLPQIARPEHYNISLTPDLERAAFHGVESIDVTLFEASKSITLNAAEITFNSVKVNANRAASLSAQVSTDASKEQVTFTVPTELPAGRIKLIIDYSGTLNGQLRGFYLSKTKKRNYAVTQFEPTDARRAFPCFDEPSFKATFDISITVDSGDTVISNMNVTSDKPVGTAPGIRKHTVSFGTTPKMSTYLVAFLVGDFECISGTSEGVTIRACATPGKAFMGRLALSVASYLMTYYNNYFGIKYPIPKLDLVALPDFEAGAMENFGAITYREPELLVDEHTATLDQKKSVAAVVAHEMAHQWFGDLVTMGWWDNVWLNEGFATWMQTKPLIKWRPEWDFSLDNAVRQDQTLSRDSLLTTRAIRASADTPSEINEMFDGIAYGKASAVLAMVENYLGQETFRQGVRNYLSAHLYANATAEDFWNAETMASQRPIDKMMSSLVVQPGAPLLRFSTDENGTLKVTQSRFFSDSTIKAQSVQSWTLPVCFSAIGLPVCELLAPTTRQLRLPSAAFLFANAGAKGYYRSAYSDNTYKDIITHAATGLTPEERIVLIGDELALMHSGLATVGNNLNLVSALRRDPSPIVLKRILKTESSIRDQIATADEAKELDAWLRRTFLSAYSALGPAPTGRDGEPQNRREMRAVLFAALGDAKDPTILKEASKLADRYITGQTSVEPSLARSALEIAASDSNGGVKLYDKLLKLRERSADPGVQDRILSTLPYFSDPVLVTRTLESISTGAIRDQDSPDVLYGLLTNRETRDQTWTYLTRHWDRIQPHLPMQFGSQVVVGAGNFCSAQKRDEVLTFFSAHKLPAAERRLKATVERINSCVQLRTAQAPKLSQWISEAP